MKLIIVWMECQNNVYVIPESIRRKDFGYKSERTTRIHADDAGCGPGLAAGRRRRNAGRRGTGGAGAGGAAALVVNQARTRLYATHRGGAGGGPGPTQRRCQ